MYGIIHNGAKAAVLAERGREAWQRVTEVCAFNDEHMISAAYYDDDLTVALVQAIGEEFDTDLAGALRLIGQHWITYVFDKGYGDILDMCGTSLRECLSNLDRMHTGLKSSLPHARMPMFELLEADGNRMVLSYRSLRKGFAPMLEGILEGLCAHYEESWRVEASDGVGVKLFTFSRILARGTQPLEPETEDGQIFNLAFG